MDTTETYIKMCDCEEIQNQVPELLEMARDAPFGKQTNLCLCGEYLFYNVGGEDKVIWLPRQDQLQEMVNENINYTIKLHGFGGIFDLMNDPDIIKATSWEQLWLAFVMKEKYNKTWDGGNWI